MVPRCGDHRAGDRLGLLAIGKSKAKVYEETETTVTFLPDAELITSAVGA